MHLPRRCSAPNKLTRLSALYITALIVSHCEDSDPEPARGDQTPLSIHTEVARMAGLSSVWMGVMGMLSLFCLHDVNCTKESVPRVKLGYKGRHLHLLGDTSERQHNEIIILRYFWNHYRHGYIDNIASCCTVDLSLHSLNTH